MYGSILITNLESDFGKRLAMVFSREGYRVYSPADLSQISRLDYFAETTDFWLAENFSISAGIDAGLVERVFRENVLVPMWNVEQVVPLLEAGDVRRLFFVSSCDASINEASTSRGFAYKMSKTALHQFLQMLRNELAPRGFTFRVFDPGKRNPENAAESAFLYITRRRGIEHHNPDRDDEMRLTLRCAEGRHHSW